MQILKKKLQSNSEISRRVATIQILDLSNQILSKLLAKIVPTHSPVLHLHEGHVFTLFSFAFFFFMVLYHHLPRHYFSRALNRKRRAHILTSAVDLHRTQKWISFTLLQLRDYENCHWRVSKYDFSRTVAIIVIIGNFESGLPSVSLVA